MTKKDEEKKSEKKVDDLKLKSGLLADRTTTKDIMIGDLCFVIKPLSDCMISLAGDGATFEGVYNGTIHVLSTIRYGLVNIVPTKGSKLFDRDGKEVEIVYDLVPVLGHMMSCISWDILRRFPMKTSMRLYKEILALSNITEKEKDSLDSTTASDQK